MLRYVNYCIALQEVPDEVSLVFNISGCTHHCPACHSKYLWEDVGSKLNKKEIDKCLEPYKDLITCICFMGGDQDILTLNKLCAYSQSLGYKTCVYSGFKDVKLFSPYTNINYLKMGPYEDDKGGLNRPTTNQIMYKVIDGRLKDITYRFQTSSVQQ